MTVLNLKVPDSLTEWVIQAIGVSDEHGFGVAEPMSLKVSKPIFIECHFPFAFTRLEQTSLSCTIYNYNENEIEVSCAICGFYYVVVLSLSWLLFCKLL